MQNHNISFSFGKNWQDFVENSFTPERLEIARRHIAEFLEVSDLRGKYFLDIGCGSGLSSLAANQLGATKIVSFDADPFSVQATKTLKNSVENSDHWEVTQASILDTRYIRGLEKADIVYSWGVLHHTGKMWEALKNAASALSDTGVFYISIYVTTPKSGYWTRVKEAYNTASNLGKRRMELQYLIRHLLFPRILRLQNPFREIRDYKKKRGMDFMADVRDWLGGYPYEHARIEEILNFARQELRLELIKIATGEAAIEYLFRKQSPDVT